MKTRMRRGAVMGLWLATTVALAQPPVIDKVRTLFSGLERITSGSLVEIIGSELGPVVASTSQLSVKHPSLEFRLNEQEWHRLRELERILSEAEPNVSSALKQIVGDGVVMPRGTSLPASVTINGQTAPVLLSSPTRLVIHTPNRLPEGQVFLNIASGPDRSIPRVVNVDPFTPAIAVDAESSDAGRFLALDGRAINSARPAGIGETILVEATGLGNTTPAPPPVGVVTPNNIVYTPDVVPQLVLNGVEVAPESVSLAPGRIGIFRIRFRVPDTLRPGSYPLSLISRSGRFSARSNEVLLPVGGSVAAPCEFQVSPSSLTLSADGGTGVIQLATGNTCQWETSSDVEWVTVSPSRGTGPASVLYRAGVNIATDARVARIVVGNKTVELTQLGQSTQPTPRLVLSRSSLTFTVRRGETSTFQEVTVTTANPANANLPLQLAASQNWIRLRSSSNTTPSTVSIAVDALTLVAGTYRATVLARSEGASNSPQSVDLTVTVTETAERFLRGDETSLEFSWQVGSPRPQPQTIRVSSTGSPIGFQAATRLPAGQRWLRVSPAVGQTVADVEASIDISDVDPGEYAGTIVISPVGPNAGAPLNIPVSLRVTRPLPSSLIFDSGSLRYSFASGEAAQSRNVLISNPSDNVLRFSIAATTRDGAPWLTTSDRRRSADRANPATFAVTANPAGLAPGGYSGSIDLEAETGEKLSIPVSMQISASDQRVELSQSSVTFVVEQDSIVQDPDQSIQLLPAKLDVSSPFTVTAPTQDIRWLLVRTQRGTLTSDPRSGDIRLGVNPQNLPPGIYEDVVRVDIPNAANSPRLIRVRLDVRQRGETLGPILSTTGMIFTGKLGEDIVGTQDVLITNRGGRRITFNSSFTPANPELPSFVTVTPASGNLGNGLTTGDLSRPIRVRIDAKGLPPGIHRGTLTFIFPDGVNRLVNVVVGIGVGTNATAGVGSDAPPACSSNSLNVVLTSTEDRINAALGESIPTQVALLNDCIELPTNAAVGTRISTGETGFHMKPLSAGRFSATWEPQIASSNSIRTEINAIDISQGLRGQTTLRIAALVALGSPIIQRDGIRLVDPGEFVNRAIRIGDLVEIRGTGLSDLAITAGEPAAKRLGQTSVTIGGIECEITGVSPTRIIVRIPETLTPNSSHQVIVKNGTRVSLGEEILIGDLP
jgi:uncharacterized protein (TIGR03437 family)